MAVEMLGVRRVDENLFGDVLNEAVQLMARSCQQIGRASCRERV